MPLEDPVEVYAATDTPEAYFVHNLLTEAGIESAVVGESLSGAIGELPPFTSNPRVWVHSGDLDRARAVVEEYERHLRERTEVASNSRPGADEEQPGDEPFCFECGQPIAFGQTPCPTCGKELDWRSTSGGAGSS